MTWLPFVTSVFDGVVYWLIACAAIAFWVDGYKHGCARMQALAYWCWTLVFLRVVLWAVS